MRAVTVTAVVRADRVLLAQVPADVPPGTHQVVIVLAEDADTSRPDPLPADWPLHQADLTDPNMTFRREDIYGEDGR